MPLEQLERNIQKQMPQMEQGKQMKHENVDFQYSDMVICCKSYYNRVVLPLASNIARMNGCSTVLCRLKGSATKAPVLRPNIVKFYKKGMREADFIDQKQQAAAYRLD